MPLRGSCDSTASSSSGPAGSRSPRHLPRRAGTTGCDGHLELDHVGARALGGTNAASNLRVRCRAHNRLAAEEVFGKAHIAERFDFRQRKSSAVATPVPPPPLVVELAVRALHNLGFRETDARRAVGHVSKHRVASGDALDVHDLLRGAIAALT